MYINQNNLYKENYKNSSKLTIVMGVCKFFKVISLIVVVYCFLGFIFAITTIDKDMLLISIFFVFVLSINLLVYFLTRSKVKFLDNVDLYVNNFKEDVDGIVKISDLARYVNQSENSIISNIQKLIKKGYIINCKIERKRDINYIVFNNSLLMQSMNDSNTVKEIVLKDLQEYNTIKKYTCPNCGATVDIKNINNVVCNYCNTKITFKKS